MKKLKAGEKQRIRNAPVQGAGHLIKKGGLKSAKELEDTKFRKAHSNVTFSVKSNH